MPVIAVGQLTIVDTNDGLYTELTSNSVVLPANTAGTITSYVGAETTLRIFEAGVDTSSSWTIFISATGGGVAYRDSNDTNDRSGIGETDGLIDGTTGFVKVTSLTQDLSYIDITAKKAGSSSITRRFSVAKAAEGAKGTRGTITTSRATTGSTWVDSEANTAISEAGGGSPLQGDIVTLYNSSAKYSETRAYSGSAWIAINAYIGGSQIINGTIATAHIAANAVTANQIAARTITAAQLAVGDFQNLAHNGQFTSAKSWSLATGVTITEDATNGYAGRKWVMTIAPDAAVRYTSNDNKFPCVAGEEFYLQWRGKVSVALTGSIQTYVRWNDANGNQISTSNVGNLTTQTGYTEFAGNVTAPANAVEGFVQQSCGNTAGTGYIGEVNIFRRNAGRLIVDGSIGTNHITTDTLDAKVLKAGTIQASKLTLTDLTNNVPNPDFRSGTSDSWSHSHTLGGNLFGSTTTVVVRTTTGVPSGAPSVNVAKANVINGSNNDHYTSQAMSVQPGETYYVEVMCASSSDCVATLDIGMHFRDLGETGHSWIVATENGTNAARVAPNTSWTKVRGIVTVPATVSGGAATAYGRIWVRVQSNATVTGNWYFTSAKLRKAASAELIVDGSITAKHITASKLVGDDIIATNSLSAELIKSGTVLTNTIKVSGTNRALSNIDSDATLGAVNPATRINDAANTTYVDPGKILINGATFLADWRNGTNSTEIFGGKVAANTITANKLSIGSRGLTIIGIEFKANWNGTATTANTLHWTPGSIGYVDVDTDGVTPKAKEDPVDQGTVAWTSGQTIYVYWAKGSPSISTTTLASTAYNANNVVLAIYRGGNDLIANYGRTIIDGAHITTGTINADRLMSGSILSQQLYLGNDQKFILHGSLHGPSKGSLVIKSPDTAPDPNVDLIKMGWLDANNIGFQIRNFNNQLLLDHNFNPNDILNSPVLDLTSDKTSFTFAEKNPVPSSQTINFTAVILYGGTTVTWSAVGDVTGAVTLSGTGLTRSLSVGSFGTNNEVRVTATIDGTSPAVSKTITIYRMEEVMLELTASGTTFTFIDNVADPANQSITFTSTVTGGASVSWSAVNQTGLGITLTGTGTTRSLSVADFGSSSSEVKVTATVTGSSPVVSRTISVYRLDDSTAEAGATVNEQFFTSPLPGLFGNSAEATAGLNSDIYSANDIVGDFVLKAKLSKWDGVSDIYFGVHADPKGALTTTLPTVFIRARDNAGVNELVSSSNQTTTVEILDAIEIVRTGDAWSFRKNGTEFGTQTLSMSTVGIKTLFAGVEDVLGHVMLVQNGKAVAKPMVARGAGSETTALPGERARNTYGGVTHVVKNGQWVTEVDAAASKPDNLVINGDLSNGMFGWNAGKLKTKLTYHTAADGDPVKNYVRLVGGSSAWINFGGDYSNIGTNFLTYFSGTIYGRVRHRSNIASQSVKFRFTYFSGSPSSGSYKHDDIFFTSTNSGWGEFNFTYQITAAKHKFGFITGIYHNGSGNIEIGEVILSRTEIGATIGAPAGTPIADRLAEDVASATTNFGARVARKSDPITTPTKSTSTTTTEIQQANVRHINNPDGTVDIIFEWDWQGDSNDIDGFLVHYRQGELNEGRVGADTAGAEFFEGSYNRHDSQQNDIIDLSQPVTNEFWSGGDNP